MLINTIVGGYICIACEQRGPKPLAANRRRNTIKTVGKENATATIDTAITLDQGYIS